MPVASNNDSILKPIAVVDSPFSNASFERVLKLKERKTHRFSFPDSLTDTATSGTWFTSPEFEVGGLKWYVRFFPNGDLRSGGEYISLFLHKRNPSADVSAMFALHLMDKRGMSALSNSTMERFGNFDGDAYWGWSRFTDRDVLDDHCIQNDTIVIDCELAVYDNLWDGGARRSYPVIVPPSEIHNNIGVLVESKEMADVTFLVDGQSIPAHKLVLAVRSPVFKAELYGPMSESKLECIPIAGMKASVFKAMLHYIYTDSLPQNATFNLGQQSDSFSDESCIPAQHLLEAADRYGLERLKLICEDNLCKTLNADTLATTLALAHQHGCKHLKSACLEFMLDPTNYIKVTLTMGYFHLMQSCPDVVLEFREKIVKSSFLQDLDE